MSDINFVLSEIENFITLQTNNLINAKSEKKWLAYMHARECLLHLKHNILEKWPMSRELTKNVLFLVEGEKP